ncbi:hypothetical protein SHJG_6099 [Streptomyces hygroscopicus subsp. jinggangensis 5008]|nr:hypothetical protein SHJG_6099 [Streptomyces hygroscopicus subsp. jinggangensis 5008]AGF65524.1 hypothetical protein SHJGH_5861 [Streptomyces hygroscopicus subsp. jinggangensis TL01]
MLDAGRERCGEREGQQRTENGGTSATTRAGAADAKSHELSLWGWRGGGVFPCDVRMRTFGDPGSGFLWARCAGWRSW